MITKTIAELPQNASLKITASRNISWLLFPGSSPDYWTLGFHVNAFPENFNLTSSYAGETMIL